MSLKTQSDAATATHAPAPQLRPATEADVPLILAFIRKLAEYGDIADEATVTEADVRAALFGPQHLADAVLAFADETPVGFALYSYTFSSFQGRPGIYVEDLFVEHSHRGGGVGKMLLVYIAKLARERGCVRLEWSVLNWNERAMEFYQDLGAVPMDEWTTFRLTDDALDRLASNEPGALVALVASAKEKNGKEKDSKEAESSPSKS